MFGLTSFTTELTNSTVYVQQPQQQQQQPQQQQYQQQQYQNSAKATADSTTMYLVQADGQLVPLQCLIIQDQSGTPQQPSQQYQGNAMSLSAQSHRMEESTSFGESFSVIPVSMSPTTNAVNPNNQQQVHQPQPHAPKVIRCFHCGDTGHKACHCPRNPQAHHVGTAVCCLHGKLRSLNYLCPRYAGSTEYECVSHNPCMDRNA